MNENREGPTKEQACGAVWPYIAGPPRRDDVHKVKGSDGSEEGIGKHNSMQREKAIPVTRAPKKQNGKSGFRSQYCTLRSKKIAALRAADPKIGMKSTPV